MQVAYPFKVGGSGRTASESGEDDHIRDLIEQGLFATPGERVNRPDLRIVRPTSRQRRQLVNEQGRDGVAQPPRQRNRSPVGYAFA